MSHRLNDMKSRPAETCRNAGVDVRVGVRYRPDIENIVGMDGIGRSYD